MKSYAYTIENFEKKNLKYDYKQLSRDYTLSLSITVVYFLDIFQPDVIVIMFTGIKVYCWLAFMIWGLPNSLHPNVFKASLSPFDVLSIKDDGFCVT